MDGLKFDFSRIKAREFAAFAKANADMEAGAELLAKVVVSVPKGWGEPADVNTYLDRPLTEWIAVQAALEEEVKNLKQK